MFAMGLKSLWKVEARTLAEQRTLFGIVASVLVLNSIDAVLTLTWVTVGIAKEANPLMDELLGRHPVAFVIGKMALVSSGSWLLWRRKDQPLAVVGLFGVFLVYYAILLVHVDALARVLQSLA